MSRSAGTCPPGAVGLPSVTRGSAGPARLLPSGRPVGVRGREGTAQESLIAGDPGDWGWSLPWPRGHVCSPSSEEGRETLPSLHVSPSFGDTGGLGHLRGSRRAGRHCHPTFGLIHNCREALLRSEEARGPRINKCRGGGGLTGGIPAAGRTSG